jgi:hypothetical protein
MNPDRLLDTSEYLGAILRPQEADCHHTNGSVDGPHERTSGLLRLAATEPDAVLSNDHA